MLCIYDAIHSTLMTTLQTTVNRKINHQYITIVNLWFLSLSTCIETQYPFLIQKYTLVTLWLQYTHMHIIMYVYV